MFYVVCSKLWGDNLQRSTKQTGLSERRLSAPEWKPFSSSLWQRWQTSHYLLYPSLLSSNEWQSQSMVGGRSWTTNDNLRSAPDHLWRQL